MPPPISATTPAARRPYRWTASRTTRSRHSALMCNAYGMKIENMVVGTTLQNSVNMSGDNGSDTVTMSDYEYVIPEEAKYFVSIGVLPASAFDTTQMTEGEDYEITLEVSSPGYLRVWATAEQLNTLVKYVAGANAGVSGDVS